MSKLIKDLIPPLLLRTLKQLRKDKYGWHGHFNSWEEAQKKSDGYDSQIIIDKVVASMQKLIDGEATFERDSVLFNEPEYNWPLVAALFYIASKNKNKLEIIDFGGSLGSTYYQNKPFFNQLESVSWNIVEQAHFVKVGQEKFSTNQLHFFETVSECLSQSSISSLLISSVLQYIEKPYVLLEELLKKEFETILIDRMPFNTLAEDRICIQKVMPSIYDASYPCHFLNLQSFKAFFSKHNYSLKVEFDALDGKTSEYKFKGFIFERA